MKKLIILFSLLLLLPSIGIAQPLSKANKDSMHEYAKKYIQDKDGACILKSISYVESRNGQFKVGVLDPSYGLMQIKIETAKVIAKKHGLFLKGSNAQIKAKLISDDRFSIKLSALHIGDLLHKFKRKDYAIIAYNIGGEGVSKRLKRKIKLPKIYLNKVGGASHKSCQ